MAREIRLDWPEGAQPTFDYLTSKLLLEIVRREAALHGKVSIRHLARTTGIPKSTLSGRLRALVDHNLTSLDDLAKLVNVGRE
jgi:DNA-binding IclR family transcriptional regulator